MMLKTQFSPKVDLSGFGNKLFNYSMVSRSTTVTLLKSPADYLNEIPNRVFEKVTEEQTKSESMNT